MIIEGMKMKTLLQDCRSAMNSSLENDGRLRESDHQFKAGWYKLVSPWAADFQIRL